MEQIVNKITTIIIILISLSACSKSQEIYTSSLSEFKKKVVINSNDARQVLDIADQYELKIPDIRKNSVAQIVFPKAIKLGLILGGNYSEGFIIKDDQVLGRVRMTGGNLGPQLGGQQYSQIMYIMTESKLNEFMGSDSFSVQGTVSYADAGTSKTTVIATQDNLKEVYTLIFNQTGYLAGITLDGVIYSVIEKYRK
jgi:lipid-binding SYLF domain-containing protein|tara:strand:- start:63 stop:653 length:591 start_codon:yes stop_codon:yes gene_type:complete